MQMQAQEQMQFPQVWDSSRCNVLQRDVENIRPTGLPAQPRNLVLLDVPISTIQSLRPFQNSL